MSTSVETAIDVRPFHVDIPDEALDDRRRPIEATKLARERNVADQSPGVLLALIQELSQHRDRLAGSGRTR